MRYLVLILGIYLPVIAAEYKKPDSPQAAAEPSHFDMPKTIPLKMIICDEALVPFNSLKEYDQCATQLYFGETDAQDECARFILKKLDDKQKEDQYCKYVPVSALKNKKTFTVLVYNLSLVADSDGEEPEKRIKRLHDQYIEQALGTEEDTHE